MNIVTMTHGVLVMLSAFISGAVGSCNSEQRMACRKSAVEDNLDLLTSGGQCLVRQYVQFTHICTVANYLPSTDSCCCVDQTLVLCCRYHQDWNHFRCVETEDLVHRFQDNMPTDLYLKIIIPLVVLVIVIFFFVILCPASRLLRCRSHNGSNSSSSSAISRFCTSAWASDSDENSHKSPVTNSTPPPDGENGLQSMSRSPRTTLPLREYPRRHSIPESHLSSAEEGSQTVLVPLVSAHAGWPTEPSAPPMDDLGPGGLVERRPVAIQYRVCHLATGDGTNAVAPVILIGCRSSAHAHNDDSAEMQSVRTVEGIYIAPQQPPTYEEATGRTCVMAETQTLAQRSDGDGENSTVQIAR